MESGPKANPAFVTERKPIQFAGEICLNRNLLDLGHPTEPDDLCLIPASDQSLAPRGEEDGNGVARLVLDPITKSFQSSAIRGQFRRGFMVLRERTIPAPVITARKGAAIEDRQIHSKENDAIKSVTRCE